MIRIRLPQEETQRLDQAFRHETDPKYRDRIHIIRLACRNRPHQDIAQDLAITPRTVQRWLNAYLDRGLDGLRPRKPKGAPARIPTHLADEVKRWVINGPAACGLDRANWTHEELADYLLKTKGIQTSAVPCSVSVPRSLSACTARPSATCAATPRNKPKPAKTLRS